MLDEQGWDDLAASEWRTLKSIITLLHPFAKFTSLLSGNESTTISCVIPAIMGMNIHLEEVSLFDFTFSACLFLYPILCCFAANER